MTSRSSQTTLAGVFDAAARRTARDLAEPGPAEVSRQAPAPIRRAGPRCEVWTPIRYVRVAQRCEFCGRHIPAASPGSSTGDRGTRAFWTQRRNRWQCLACHAELVRVEIARERCAASSCPSAAGPWAGCAGFCREGSPEAPPGPLA